jgi:hypothetical protein
MTVDPTPRVRPGRRASLAIRATAAVAAITIAACSSDSAGEPAAASTTSRNDTTTVDATTVTSGFPTTTGTIGHGAAAVTFSMPDGWTNIGWGLIKGDPAFGLLSMEVRNTYTDACPSIALDPPTGPTVDDLASAWADLPAFDATAPTDITVHGFHGKQVEFTVPDYDEVECPYGELMLLQDNTGQDGYWAQAPNQRHDLWILDVDGTRLVIAAFWYPDTSPQDLAELEAIRSSIQIG